MVPITQENIVGPAATTLKTVEPLLEGNEVRSLLGNNPFIAAIRPTFGMPNIDKEYGARRVAPVPRFMFVAVIEQKTAAGLPMTDFLSDTNTGLLRDFEAQVAAQDSSLFNAVSPVRLDLCARRKSRESSRNHSRKRLNQRRCSWTQGTVSIEPLAESIESENLPIVRVVQLMLGPRTEVTGIEGAILPAHSLPITFQDRKLGDYINVIKHLVILFFLSIFLEKCNPGNGISGNSRASFPSG